MKELTDFQRVTMGSLTGEILAGACFIAHYGEPPLEALRELADFVRERTDAIIGNRSIAEVDWSVVHLYYVGALRQALKILGEIPDA